MKKPKNDIDIKYLNIPNICFSLTKEDDKREKKYSKQRKTRGYDDSETWSLRDSIANFILPRLKTFQERTVGCPCSMEHDEWNGIIGKMIRAFELVSRDQGSFDLTPEEDKEYDEGFKLFYEYYLHLWW